VKFIRKYFENKIEMIYKLILPNLMIKEIGCSVNEKKNIENWDQYILASRLIGPPGAHSRENILGKIAKFVEKQQCGEDGQYRLNLPILKRQEILDKVIRVCGISNEPEYLEGQDWVSIDAFKNGILPAVNIAGKIARESGTILMATGHPESLPPAYTYIGKCLVNEGAHLYNPSIYSIPSTKHNQWLGSICGVTMVFKTTEVKHTHDDCRLYEILLKEKVRPDLVIADHGMAGAAIRSGIPTIAIVDTNDIELIVASCTYPDRVFPVPLNDNAGIKPTMALAYYFEHLIYKNKVGCKS